jgi:hypothetical protein
MVILYLQAPISHVFNVCQISNRFRVGRCDMDYLKTTLQLICLKNFYDLDHILREAF